MKIIHLASGDLWAGAEVQLFHMVTALSKQKNTQVKVVLLNHGKLEEQLIAQGVSVGVLDESKLSAFRIFLRFYTISRNLGPDIIHTHRLKENIIGGVVSSLLRIKSLRTIHGDIEVNLKTFDFRRRLAYWLDRISGMIFQDRIIAVSPELKDMLKKIYPEKKISVVENCVNEHYVLEMSKKTCEHTLNKTHFNIAFIGRLVPIKNPKLFYEIAKYLITSSSNNSLHFHIVGDGPLYVELEKQTKLDGLENRVHIYGFIENVLPLLKQMNLLLFTSNSEGLPMALLEAMTLNIPVLARNLPSVKHVLCRGNCGYFVEKDTLDNYLNQINYIINNFDDVTNKAVRAKQQISLHYNITSNLKNYSRIYKHLLNGRI